MSATPGRLGFGIIGAGRVGPVLAGALRAAEHAIVGVHALSQDSRDRAEAMLPGVPVLEVPELLRRSEAVLLAVPDDELPGLVTGLAEAGHWRAGQLVIHTSARCGVDVLTPAREAGAIPLALHPVVSFTGTSLDLQRLTGAAFGVTSDPLMVPVAQALVVELGGEPVFIEEEDRPAFAAALEVVRTAVAAAAGVAWRRLDEAGVGDPSSLLQPLLRDVAHDAAVAGPGGLARLGARAQPGSVRSAVGSLAGTPAGPELLVASLRAAVAEGVSLGKLGTEQAVALLAAIEGPLER